MQALFMLRQAWQQKPNTKNQTQPQTQTRRNAARRQSQQHEIIKFSHADGNN